MVGGGSSAVYQTLCLYHPRYTNTLDAWLRAQVLSDEKVEPAILVSALKGVLQSMSQAESLFSDERVAGPAGLELAADLQQNFFLESFWLRQMDEGVPNGGIQQAGGPHTSKERPKHGDRRTRVAQDGGKSTSVERNVQESAFPFSVHWCPLWHCLLQVAASDLQAVADQDKSHPHPTTGLGALCVLLLSLADPASCRFHHSLRTALMEKRSQISLLSFTVNHFLVPLASTLASEPSPADVWAALYDTPPGEDLEGLHLPYSIQWLLEYLCGSLIHRAHPETLDSLLAEWDLIEQSGGFRVE